MHTPKHNKKKTSYMHIFEAYIPTVRMIVFEILDLTRYFALWPFLLLDNYSHGQNAQ